VHVLVMIVNMLSLMAGFGVVGMGCMHFESNHTENPVENMESFVIHNPVG